MLLKKTDSKPTNFNKTNVKIFSFAENGNRKSLILSDNPENAKKVSDQFFLEGIIGKLSIPL